MNGTPAPSRTRVRGHVPALIAAGLGTGACGAAASQEPGALGGVALLLPGAALALAAGLALARATARCRGARTPDGRGTAVSAALLALSIAVAVPVGAGAAALVPLLVTAVATGFVIGVLGVDARGPAGADRSRTGAAYPALWLTAAVGVGCTLGLWRLPETRAVASALACACALLRLAATSHAHRTTPPPP